MAPALCGFVTPPAGNVYPETLPALDIGEGWETAPGFHGPPGQYTAAVTIPSKNVSISKSFAAGNSSTNAFTDTYDPPGSCTVVADTRQQLDDLTLQHVRAVAIWVGRMEASPLRTQLIQLADRAYAAASANDRATALVRRRAHRACAAYAAGSRDLAHQVVVVVVVAGDAVAAGLGRRIGALQNGIGPV